MQQQVKMTITNPTKRTTKSAIRAMRAGSKMAFLGAAVEETTLTIKTSVKTSYCKSMARNTSETYAMVLLPPRSTLWT